MPGDKRVGGGGELAQAVRTFGDQVDLGVAADLADGGPAVGVGVEVGDPGVAAGVRLALAEHLARLVEGDDNSIANLGIAVDTAVSMGAKFVSNSYGILGEDSSETSFDQYYTHPGVAVVASTGDTGNLTNWPATNPNVTAAGGTTLTKDTSVPRGWTETA
jgi:hypothetical protein